jgi:hypothetical protein
VDGDELSDAGGNDGDAEVGNPSAEVLAPTPGDAPGASKDTSISLSPDSVSTTHARRWVIGVVVVAVVVVGVVVGIIISSTSAGITTGTGTATITWTPVAENNPDTIGNPPQPFAGTIDGNSVSGVATTPFTTANGQKITGIGQLSQKIRFIEWKGNFGGKPFNVGVFANYASGTPLTNPLGRFPMLTIAGKWGDEQIVGKIATPSAAELKQGNPPAHFSGTVGDLKVSGTAQPPAGGGKHQSGTATFTVSK